MTSILRCTERNSGTARMSTSPMTRIMIGTMTRSSPESSTFSRRAMITPPIMVIGADTMRSRAMMMNVWTCWMLLVFRVISDGAPKVFTSRSEKLCTRWNIAPRTSRPKPMAVAALK